MLSSLHPPTLQPVSPLRGFSSAKFLPGSKDEVIVALKSEENSERDRQTTYITIYKQDAASGGWRVLLEETELPHEAKFEGLEVLSWS
jgi:soluble calcium-activated nucleotidase 1